MSGPFLEKKKKTVGKCEEKDAAQIKGHKLRKGKGKRLVQGQSVVGPSEATSLGGVLTWGTC